MGRHIISSGLPIPGELQDSYSDVYSLGVVMAQMCKPAHFWLPSRIKRLLRKDEAADPSGKRIFSSYYSPQLKELVRRCRSINPLERPSIYSLYLETKSGMEAFRDRAYQEDQESQESVEAGIAIHHSKVLYTKVEQDFLDDDPDFKRKYENANRNPVLEADRNMADAMQAFESEEVDRNYEKIIQSIDESITTPIPQSPEYDSYLDSLDAPSSLHSSPSEHSNEPTPGPLLNRGKDVPRAEVAIMTPRNDLPHDYSVWKPPPTRKKDQRPTFTIWEDFSERDRPPGIPISYLDNDHKDEFEDDGAWDGL